MKKGESKDNSFGIASVTLGILSIVFAGINGVILGVVALIFANIQQKSYKTKWGNAGVILSIIGIILSIIMVFVLLYLNAKGISPLYS